MARAATQKRPETFSRSLARVVTKNERVVVRRRGKAVAALIPLEDLALLVVKCTENGSSLCRVAIRVAVQMEDSQIWRDTA
ncbi:MAG: hypothetical protein FJ147_08470 [Deltaproteobacteria bacterium]|nr:hypothetical protein [Deltaproteobacteria bacterium]